MTGDFVCVLLLLELSNFVKRYFQCSCASGDMIHFNPSGLVGCWVVTVLIYRAHRESGKLFLFSFARLYPECYHRVSNRVYLPVPPPE